MDRDLSQVELSSLIDYFLGVWGGRFSPILKLENGELSERQWGWLTCHDPDVLLLAAPISDQMRRKIWRTVDPAEILEPNNYDRRATIAQQLKLRPVESLWNAHARYSRRHPPQIPERVLDSLGRIPEARSLADTFGFLSHSFDRFPVNLPSSDFIARVLLTNDQIAGDPRQLPRNLDFIVATSAEAAWSHMLRANGLQSLALLAAANAPRTDIGISSVSSALQVVVGETVDDRLLYWNYAYFSPAYRDHQVVAMRVTCEDLDRPDCFAALRHWFDHRSYITPDGVNGSHVHFSSTSMSEAHLNEIVERFRDEAGFTRYSSSKVESLDELVPTVERFNAAYFDMPVMGNKRSNWKELSFQGNHLSLPDLSPEPLRRTAFPEFSRHDWATEFVIERDTDHSKYVNVRHVWKLPRSLRMQGAFGVTRQAGQNLADRANLPTRTSLQNYPVFFSSIDEPIIDLSVPQDERAFQEAYVLHNRYRRDDAQPWEPKAPAQNWSLSDKGAYLKGVLGLLNGVRPATAFASHRFWREQLKSWGATSKVSDEAVASVLNSLTKRTRNQDLTDDEILSEVAEIAVKQRKAFRAPVRGIRFSKLNEEWTAYLEEFRARDADQYPEGEERSDWDHYEENSLKTALEQLVSRSALSQGISNRCRKCHNENWFAVSDIQEIMECRICSTTHSIPMLVDWEFRLNPFLLECFGEQGIEAVIWALGIVYNRAETSLMFREPTDLWLENSENPRPDTDIDLSAVIDGRFFAIEVKSSKRLFSVPRRRQFAELARKLQPDVAVAAVMDSFTLEQRRNIESELRALVANDEIEIQFWTLSEFELRDTPHLNLW
ncbi:MAG: hypothetical protein RLN72_16505 [Henriciella sp.]